MRSNSLKAKLRAGQRVVGALITINSPELVETFGHLGYDFVFIDGQHGGLGVETARELIRAAELNHAVLGELDAAVRVPDLDVVAIGPGDLSLSMGIPDGWKDPRVQAEVARVHAAARAAGKPAMIVALDHDDGRRLVAEGYQAILVVSGPLLANAARSFLQVLRA